MDPASCYHQHNGRQYSRVSGREPSHAERWWESGDSSGSGGGGPPDGGGLCAGDGRHLSPGRCPCQVVNGRRSRAGLWSGESAPHSRRSRGADGQRSGRACRRCQRSGRARRRGQRSGRACRRGQRSGRARRRGQRSGRTCRCGQWSSTACSWRYRGADNRREGFHRKIRQLSLRVDSRLEMD